MSSKVLAFTCVDKNFADIAEIVIPVNRKYFSKHNIEYEINKVENELEQNQKMYYHKFFLLNKYLEERKDIDYIFMMDTDMVITNKEIDLRVFTCMTDKNILACSVVDSGPDMYWNINTGSLIVKNNNQSHQFINEYLNVAKKNNYKFNDQALMQHILRNYKTDLFCIFPANSFNHGCKNSLLYHACKYSSTNNNFNDALKEKEHLLKSNISE